MKIRFFAALTSAFFAGLFLALGIHTAIASNAPTVVPPDGNISPHFYAMDVDTDADFGQPELDDNNDVRIDGDGSVYAQTNTLAYNIWGYNSAADPGEVSILGRVITTGVRNATVTGYVGYVDSTGDAYGLYTDGNLGVENIFVDSAGIVHTNQITADTGSLDVVASGGMNLASTDLDVDGDVTANTLGSFRYECAGVTSGTSVTASCDGANDIMVACSGYSINDYEGAIPTSATDCTAYTTSDSVSLQAYAYCFDPSSTTNTTSTTCTNDYSRFRDNEVVVTVDMTDTTAPSAPTGLSATPSGTTVSLNWNDNDSSEGVSYYNVYRSTTSGFSVGSSYKIGTATASAYSDTGRSQGTTYYYKVTAVDDSDNESSASSQASATIADTTAPSAPTGVSCTTTSSTVSLDWSDNASSDGVSSYNIYRSTTSGFTASSSNKIKSGQTSSSYTNSSLSSSTTYYYKITAVDSSSNESSTSSQKTCTTTSSGGSSGGSSDGVTGTGSFVAGTKVLTFAGLKNIEDLKVGDKVFSFDTEKNHVVVGTVTIERSRVNDHYYLINDRLKVTALHPMAVMENGAVTWKKVQDLVVGDVLVTSNQKTTPLMSITRVEVPEGITVYNPSIDGPHNYFVLLNDLIGILVHNKISNEAPCENCD